MSKGCHPDPVRVGGVHDDAGDDLRLLEPLELPGEPPVHGLVDPPARRDGVPGIFLPAAGPDLHGVRRGDGEVPHRDDPFLGEEGPEGDAVVGGLPDAAGSGSEEEGLGGARNAFHIGDPPHHVCRSHGPPAEGRQCGGVQRCGQLGLESGVENKNRRRRREKRGYKRQVKSNRSESCEVPSHRVSWAGSAGSLHGLRGSFGRA